MLVATFQKASSQSGQRVMGLASVGSIWRVLKGGTVPIDGAHDDRDDASGAGLMSLQGALHFDAVAVVRGHEVRANEE